MVKIIIDEEKCDGCGLCIPSCHEGALAIVDGKARLVNESLCDGMGACIGECPRGAITLVEEKTEACGCHAAAPAVAPGPVFSCPSSRALSFNKESKPANSEAGEISSELRQWPIQLHLVSPNAPYFKNCDLLIAADCTAFSFGDFHRKYLKNKAVVVACPKLDSGKDIYVDKLRKIFEQQQPRSIMVLMMEVPCCSQLLGLAKEALSLSGQKIEMKVVVLGLSGGVLMEQVVDG
jgi:Pyruvate/2-oxoacid:ferredoxin oxidoreductase delta subunit